MAKLASLLRAQLRRAIPLFTSQNNMDFKRLSASALPSNTKPKPPITSFGALLALANSVKPKLKRGRTPKYSQQDKVILIAIADRTIRDHEKITTDIAAIEHLCSDLPAKSRRTAIAKYAKLLSRFRKEIAN